jgi:hypothetical protein
VGKHERKDLEDLAAGQMIILKENFKEYVLRTWTGLIWFRI